MSDVLALLCAGLAFGAVCYQIGHYRGFRKGLERGRWIWKREP